MITEKYIKLSAAAAPDIGGAGEELISVSCLCKPVLSSPCLCASASGLRRKWFVSRLVRLGGPLVPACARPTAPRQIDQLRPARQ